MAMFQGGEGCLEQDEAQITTNQTNMSMDENLGGKRYITTLPDGVYFKDI